LKPRRSADAKLVLVHDYGCSVSATTCAVDLLTIMFRALTASEQDDAAEAINRIRILRLAGEQSEAGRMLSSLIKVASGAGTALTPDLYRSTHKRLLAAGEDVEPLHRVIRHYGTWRQAKEAIELSADTTARRIDARFQSRRLGKVWRYTEKTLGETLRNCLARYGRAMTVAEFEHWREREIELARARGEVLHLPSASPYRKRWGSWEGALNHFGITGDDATRRFQGS
jgi:hypothetical protein